VITFLLLLPVGSILVWLYWYGLPAYKKQNRRWRWVDTGFLSFLLILASLFVYTKMHSESPSPMWSEIVAVSGAYGIIAIGLSIGLIVRRIFFKTK
jgi:hypothetical protein